jgi:hypothetical protein
MFLTPFTATKASSLTSTAGQPATTTTTRGPTTTTTTTKPLTTTTAAAASSAKCSVNTTEPISTEVRKVDQNKKFLQAFIFLSVFLCLFLSFFYFCGSFYCRALRQATCMLASADVERVAVGSLTNPQNVRILESILPPEIFQVFIKKGDII